MVNRAQRAAILLPAAQEKLYGDVPPAALVIASPSIEPAQSASATPLKVMDTPSAGSPMVTVVVVMQPLASMTITEYVARAQVRGCLVWNRCST